MNKILKNALICSAGMFCGLLNDLLLKNTLTVFLYHDVTEHPSEFSRTCNLNVPPEVFKYQIKFIKNNFNIISPDDLLEGSIPAKAALITFDDGFLGYFKNAIPILEKNEVPSIIFLNMEAIKGGVFYAGLITYLCQKRADFRRYLRDAVGDNLQEPLYRSCGRSIVKAYLKDTKEDFQKEVAEFTGAFAEEKNLDEACHHRLVYYGNHLYNHDISRLLSDEELLDSFFENQKALKKYPNYRNMFAFPFGQPQTSYTDDQTRLLLENGAEKLFSVSGRVNNNIHAACLDRLGLTFSHNSASKIWFTVLKKKLFYYSPKQK